jgi:hypothetical protein
MTKVSRELEPPLEILVYFRDKRPLLNETEILTVQKQS